MCDVTHIRQPINVLPSDVQTRDTHINELSWQCIILDQVMNDSGTAVTTFVPCVKQPREKTEEKKDQDNV